MARRGTVIIADNVVRDGAVIDEGSDDTRCKGRAPSTISPDANLACGARDPDRWVKGLARFAVVFVTN